VRQLYPIEQTSVRLRHRVYTQHELFNQLNNG